MIGVAKRSKRPKTAFPKELFATLAEGMDHILRNAEEYYADSEHMAARERGPSFGVLRNIAEEEAAKYLLLLDAVCCPR